MKNLRLYEEAGRRGFPFCVADGIAVAGTAQWRLLCLTASPTIAEAFLSRLEARAAEPPSRTNTLVIERAPLRIDAATPHVVERSHWPFSDSQAELARYSRVPFTEHQFSVLARAQQHVRRLGLELPDSVSIQSHEAPPTVVRGTAEHDTRAGEYRILLRSDLEDAELAAVFFHECQHLGDMLAGIFDDLDEDTREAEADRFRDHAMRTFEC